MKEDNDRLLQAYIATSGYTIQALEKAIEDLKETIRKSGSRVLIPVFQERVEELEEYLLIITYLD